MPKLGCKHTPETKAKISAAHLGRVGELGNAWKGDFAGYIATHQRHQKVMSGTSCVHEDESCKGPLQLAFVKGTPKQRVLYDVWGRGPYSTRIEDYTRLCASHHNRYDRGVK